MHVYNSVPGSPNAPFSLGKTLARGVRYTPILGFWGSVSDGLPDAGSSLPGDLMSDIPKPRYGYPVDQGRPVLAP